MLAKVKVLKLKLQSEYYNFLSMYHSKKSDKYFEKHMYEESEYHLDLSIAYLLKRIDTAMEYSKAVL